MVKFYMQLLGGEPCNAERLRPQNEDWVLETLPFTSTRKRASIVLKHPNPAVKDLVRVYCKGAPDVLFEKVAKVVGKNGRIAAADAQVEVPAEL